MSLRRIIRAAALAIIIVVLGGCVTTGRRYPNWVEDGESDSKITIWFSRVSPDVSVVIDEKMVLNCRRLDTRRVIIRGVPPGTHTIHVFATGWILKDLINEKKTVFVPVEGDVRVVIPVRCSTAYLRAYLGRPQWVYSGTSIPRSSRGINGNLYFNTEIGAVYVKINGTWENVADMQSLLGKDRIQGPARER